LRSKQCRKGGITRPAGWIRDTFQCGHANREELLTKAGEITGSTPTSTRQRLVSPFVNLDLLASCNVGQISTLEWLLSAQFWQD
jgi:hypothetical protein